MKWFYFECDLGCGIRDARNLESAERSITREVGTANSVRVVREATEKDISWVRSMGGMLPLSQPTMRAVGRRGTLPQPTPDNQTTIERQRDTNSRRR